MAFEQRPAHQCNDYLHWIARGTRSETSSRVNCKITCDCDSQMVPISSLLRRPTTNHTVSCYNLWKPLFRSSTKRQSALWSSTRAGRWRRAAAPFV